MAEAPPVPPSDTYRIAVDEYRWQAQFNWSRTQYFLAFNAAILAAAAGLSAASRTPASLVFGLGVVASILSAIVVRTQHGYYRAARNHLRRVEVALDIAEGVRLDTTGGMGKRARLVSVNVITYILLAAIAVADAVGVIYSARTG